MSACINSATSKISSGMPPSRIKYEARIPSFSNFEQSDFKYVLVFICILRIAWGGERAEVRTANSSVGSRMTCRRITSALNACTRGHICGNTSSDEAEPSNGTRILLYIRSIVYVKCSSDDVILSALLENTGMQDSILHGFLENGVDRFRRRTARKTPNFSFFHGPSVESAYSVYQEVLFLTLHRP